MSVRAGLVGVLGATAVCGTIGEAFGQCPTAPAVVHETQKETALMPQQFGAFGLGVAIDGDWAVVGSPEAGPLFAGRASVYRRTAGGWVLQQELISSEELLGLDEARLKPDFSYSVDISGDAILVGSRSYSAFAVRDDLGNLIFPARAGVGKFYIFRFDGTNWVEEAGIVPDLATATDSVGVSVDIDGDVAVIGAWTDDSICPDGWAEVHEACLQNCDSGAAYVYRRDAVSGEWAFEAKLIPSNGLEDDEFGSDVAIAGNVIVVGSGNHGHTPKQCLPNPNDPLALPGIHSFGDGRGVAYVYRFNGTDWVEEEILDPISSISEGPIGKQVGISDDGSEIFLPARGDDQTVSDSGAVYMYRHDGVAWNLTQKIKTTDRTAGDSFGTSVDSDGDMLVVGATNIDVGADRTGGAYVFRKDALSGFWTQVAKIAASDAQEFDAMGFWRQVAISNGTVMLGAPGEDHPGVCCDANQFCTSGAAYFFDTFADTNGNGLPDLCDGTSGPTPSTTCNCEVDGASETIDVFDLLAYLERWFTVNRRAERDGVCGVDVFDLLAYLDCWFDATDDGVCG